MGKHCITAKNVVFVTNMKSVYCIKEVARMLRNILLETEQKVFLVAAAKRMGYTKNVVFECEVQKIIITENTPTYYCKALRCVLGKENIKEWVGYYSFKNSNIDTGHYSQYDYSQHYPIFTTKEKCERWLKQK